MSAAILEFVDRLSKLIDDVLDLTTGDAGGVALEKERVDVAGLCRAAVDTAKARAAEKAQKLEADIQPTAGHVFGDARRLREVGRACAPERRSPTPTARDGSR